MTNTTDPEATRSADSSPKLIRLANRITLLTLFAAFATVIGLALLQRAFADGPLLLRLATTLPLLVAIGTVLYVRRLRAELRAVRQAHPGWRQSHRRIRTLPVPPSGPSGLLARLPQGPLDRARHPTRTPMAWNADVLRGGGGERPPQAWASTSAAAPRVRGMDGELYRYLRSSTPRR